MGHGGCPVAIRYIRCSESLQGFLYVAQRHLVKDRAVDSVENSPGLPASVEAPARWPAPAPTNTDPTNRPNTLSTFETPAVISARSAPVFAAAEARSPFSLNR